MIKACKAVSIHYYLFLLNLFEFMIDGQQCQKYLICKRIGQANPKLHEKTSQDSEL